MVLCQNCKHTFKANDADEEVGTTKTQEISFTMLTCPQCKVFLGIVS
jgi:rubredoxin